MTNFLAEMFSGSIVDAEWDNVSVTAEQSGVVSPHAVKAGLDSTVRSYDECCTIASEDCSCITPGSNCC